MIPFKNDLTIELVEQSKFTDAQVFLHEFTGKSFGKKEAQTIWEKVVDHKWYVSERLQRDIGLRVATIDYIENICEPVQRKSLQSSFFSKLFNPVANIASSYLTAKGNQSVS